MRRSIGPWLLAGASLLGGCRTHTATQLLVVLGTNIAVGTSLENIEIQVWDGDGRQLLGQRIVSVSSTPTPPLTVAMPFSFGVAPSGGDASRRVRVTARGRFRDTGLRDRVVLTAITGFLENQKLLLPMLLDQRCIDVTNCADGLTCIGGTCQPAAVDPRRLVSVDMDSPVSLASVFDASSPDVTEDASADAVTDAPVDAPADAVPSDAGTDATTIDASTDVGSDAGTDVHVDIGTDVPVMDAPADVGVDASVVDASIDLPDADVPPAVDRPTATDAPTRSVVLLAPATGSELMTGRPPLRWRATTTAGQVVSVVFCRERDCSGVRRMETVLTGPIGGDWLLVAGSPSGIDPGLWWWSVHLDGALASESWSFTVPPGRGTVSGTPAPWRTLADFVGDGVPSVVVGAPMLDGVVIPGEEATVEGFDPRPGGRSFQLGSPRGGAAPRYASGVAVAGDVDGDGRIDLAVAETGQGVHVYLSPLPTEVHGMTRVTTLLEPGTTEYGGDVVGVGDVERDGYADLAISAQGPSAGLVWLYRGGPGGPTSAARVPLAPRDLPASPRYGRSLAGAGDVNGDGFSDIVVADFDQAVAYIFQGGPLGPSSIPRSLRAPAGWSGSFAERVAPAGDVNADGFGDVVVAGDRDVVLFLGESASPGARTASPAIAGAPCLFGATNPVLNVAGVGDVNGDGFDDLLVVAPGRCAVLFRGAPGSLTMLAQLTTITAPSGQSGFGAAAAGVGDVDDDGLPDFAIGAPAPMGVMPPPGTVGVWSGRASWAAISPTPSWSRTGSTSHFGRRFAR